MRAHTSSNANVNFSKSAIIKAGSTFTFPRMVSSLSSPNRPRIVSLDFHSSAPRPLPRLRLLPRNLSKKLVNEHQGTSDYHPMDLSAPMPVKEIDHEICLTPAPSFERDVWIAGPPVLAGEKSRILHSPVMSRKLLVPDDF